MNILNLKPILILGGIILLLVGVLAWQQARLEKAIVEREQAIDYNLAKDDSLVIMKTTNGQLASRSTVLELTIRNLERLQSDKDLQWLKYIEGINKRMNNVEQISLTTARVVASFRIPVGDTTILSINEDTVFGQLFDNKDPWVRLQGIILHDTLIVKPEVNVPLQSVVYWERAKWPRIKIGTPEEGEEQKVWGLRIGKKSWYKQTTSANPYVRITEDKLIRISKKKRK